MVARYPDLMTHTLSIGFVRSAGCLVGGHHGFAFVTHQQQWRRRVCGGGAGMSLVARAPGGVGREEGRWGAGPSHDQVGRATGR